MFADPPRWHARAACAGRGDLDWFPSPAADVTAHKAVCDPCPVAGDCLAWALEHHEYGVWAGTSEADRAAMRKAA